MIHPNMPVLSVSSSVTEINSKLPRNSLEMSSMSLEQGVMATSVEYVFLNAFEKWDTLEQSLTINFFETYFVLQTCE